MIPLLPLAAGAGAAALGYRTFWWEPRRVGLSFHALELPFWPAAVDGLRVGVMADLHAGAPHVPIAQVTRLVSWLNREEPDLIVLLGRLRLAARARRPARGARAGGAEPRRALARRWACSRCSATTTGGCTAARWAPRSPPRASACSRTDALQTGPLWVAGLADLREREPSIGRTFGAIPEGEPVLALSHDPDLFPFIPDRVALTLSGHTHGNQVNVPLLRNFVTPSHFGTRYGGGHVIEEGRHLFVSRGVGTSTLPGRFRAPPEIVLLELRSA